jgi:transformation/transcription domain-associated protein
MIDPFSITWFKKLHKFYADPYWDRFQLTLKSMNIQPGSNVNLQSLIAATASANSNEQPNATNLSRYRGLLTILNDPNYQATRSKFLIDFNLHPGQTMHVDEFVEKVKSWIGLIENHLHTQSKKQIFDERFRHVTQFCSKTSELELPGDYLVTRSNNYSIKISRFLPWYDLVEKYGGFSRRISIRGHNGKIYPYLISIDMVMNQESRKDEHVLQLMRFINTYLMKQKETARRNLTFSIPRIASLSAEVRLIEDDFSSVSLLDIYKHMKRRDTKFGLQIHRCADLPLAAYFDKIKLTSGSQYDMIEIFRDISKTHVPTDTIKTWALSVYSDATDYFNLRKTFTVQLAMYNIAEYAFHLTRTNPDTFYVSQDTGLCQNIKCKFDIPDNPLASFAKSPLESIAEWNAYKQVPFRLTPNITEFITSFGVYGLKSAVMIATVRCLLQPHYNFSWLLRAIIKDEISNIMNKKVKLFFI